MQAQHHRREDRVVVRAPALVGGEIAERERAGLPAERGARVRRLALHVTTEERALHQVVRPARVRQLVGQLRVDGGAMQTLAVVLQYQLPVGADVVLDAPHRGERGEIEPREPPLQRAEHLRERLGPRGEVREQEPFPALQRRGVQRVVGLTEACDLVHMRRAHQPPVEPIGPRMIWALDGRGEMPAGPFAQPRAAMAAHIIEGAHHTRGIADHDETLAGNLGHQVVPGLRDGRRPPHAHPAPPEDALRFLGEHLGRRVIPARHGARTLLVGLGGLVKRRRHPATSFRICRAASRPAAPAMPPPGCAPEPHRYKPGTGVR